MPENNFKNIEITLVNRLKNIMKIHQKQKLQPRENNFQTLNFKDQKESFTTALSFR